MMPVNMRRLSQAQRAGCVAQASGLVLAVLRFENTAPPIDDASGHDWSPRTTRKFCCVNALCTGVKSLGCSALLSTPLLPSWSAE